MKTGFSNNQLNSYVTTLLILGQKLLGMLLGLMLCSSGGMAIGSLIWFDFSIWSWCLYHPRD